MGSDLTAECQEHRKEIIMKKNIFTINFTNNTISGSKSALKKASNPASDEYKELTAKMAAHPTFKVVEKEPNAKKNTVKAFAEVVKHNGYPIVRKWFVEQFPHYRKNPLFYLNNSPLVLHGSTFIESMAAEEGQDAA